MVGVFFGLCIIHVPLIVHPLPAKRRSFNCGPPYQYPGKFKKESIFGQKKCTTNYAPRPAKRLSFSYGPANMLGGILLLKCNSPSFSALAGYLDIFLQTRRIIARGRDIRLFVSFSFVRCMWFFSRTAMVVFTSPRDHLFLFFPPNEKCGGAARDQPPCKPTTLRLHLSTPQNTREHLFQSNGWFLGAASSQWEAR